MAMPDFMAEDTEIRCPGGILAVLKDGLLEIKCRHWACTRGNNVTYHYINPITGDIVDTIRYKDPIDKFKEK